MPPKSRKPPSDANEKSPLDNFYDKINKYELQDRLDDVLSERTIAEYEEEMRGFKAEEVIFPGYPSDLNETLHAGGGGKQQVKARHNDSAPKPTMKVENKPRLDAGTSAQSTSTKLSERTQEHCQDFRLHPQGHKRV